MIHERLNLLKAHREAMNKHRLARAAMAAAGGAKAAAPTSVSTAEHGRGEAKAAPPAKGGGAGAIRRVTPIVTPAAMLDARTEAAQSPWGRAVVVQRPTPDPLRRVRAKAHDKARAKQGGRMRADGPAVFNFNGVADVDPAGVFAPRPKLPRTPRRGSSGSIDSVPPPPPSGGMSRPVGGAAAVLAAAHEQVAHGHPVAANGGPVHGVAYHTAAHAPAHSTLPSHPAHPAASWDLGSDDDDLEAEFYGYDSSDDYGMEWDRHGRHRSHGSDHAAVPHLPDVSTHGANDHRHVSASGASTESRPTAARSADITHERHEHGGGAVSQGSLDVPSLQSAMDTAYAQYKSRHDGGPSRVHSGGSHAARARSPPGQPQLNYTRSDDGKRDELLTGVRGSLHDVLVGAQAQVHRR